MRATVWQWRGKGAWYFVTLPKSEADQIKAATLGRRRGWGSVPVVVTIGKTVFKTSIFPEKKSGSFLLPLKAEVRKKEEIADKDTISFNLSIEQ